MATENTKEEGQGREKNRISVTIRHEGQTATIEFNIHQKIKKVLVDAIAALGLQPPPNSVTYLEFEGNRLDDPEKSLQDYQIPDGAVIDLYYRTGAG